MADKLTDYIDELVQSKTFSLEGLEAIKRLKDKAEQLETRNEQLSKTLEEKTTRLMLVEGDLSIWRQKDDELKTRAQSITEREKKITDLEKSEAVSKAESAIYGRVFSTIFSNRIIRENVQKDVPVPMGATMNSPGYVGTYQQREGVTREEG